MAAGAIVVGLLMAGAPAFSGLALLAVLITGAVVGFGVFAAPYPPATARPSSDILRWWLIWAATFVAVEVFVLRMGDDLRWPTLSALQDPVTTAHPGGRFLAGVAWAAVGGWLISLTARYPPSPTYRPLAWMVTLGLLLLAAASARDGAMLQPRDAPIWQAAGVDNTALSQWPATAWLTFAVFAALTCAAVLIDRTGRRARPPGAVPDLLSWLMAPLPGRMAVYACWLWCGWHFLAR